MRDLYDLMEMAQLPYVLLGDVARQIQDGADGYNQNTLQVDKIEVAMFQRNLTPEVMSLFGTWMLDPWEYGYQYNFQGVPVYIRVVQKRYKFFELPDMKFYGPDYFKLPNPFEKYWKARFIIK